MAGFSQAYQATGNLHLEVTGAANLNPPAMGTLTLSIGGEERSIDPGGEPSYSAVYEIESPEVLVSEAWAEAIEKGRWPTEVRPYTRNRRHTLHKVAG